jgi:hypothetical protein
MRITLKQSEIQKALLAFVAQSGIGGDAVQTAQVVFTKGRKGNGLTAEVVIGEDPVVEADEEEADEVEAGVGSTQAAVTATAEVADPFATL